MLDRLILNRLARDTLSVIAFHKVPLEPDLLVPGDFHLAAFERVLAFIVENFRVLPLAEAVGRLPYRDFAGPTACLTFDDGYSDWLTGAVPVIERLGLPATFFITAGQFFGRPMWHERLANIVRKFQGSVLDTQAYRLPPLKTETLRNKVDALQVLEYHFKYLPLAIRDRYLDQLEHQVGVSIGDVPSMCTADLVEISNRGFEIGAHTLEHPILGLCDADRAREEIGTTREILEGMIKAPVRAFAYPNGRPGIDFSPRHIDMVKSAGYRYAVTTQRGVARHGSSPFQIPRFTPWGPTRGSMTFQLIRNLYAKPDSLKETA
ncbi:MAG: polysaccharide deacetylase family protein [Rhodocyclaceae bacterium]|nr:polysaccharide deacetylase family protein [Rhodocyclaceae bacterium]